MRPWTELRASGNDILRRLPPDLGRDLDSPADAAFNRSINRGCIGGVRRTDLPADSPVWEQILDIYRQVYGDPYPHCSAWISFRLYRLLLDTSTKGYAVDVAHLA